MFCHYRILELHFMCFSYIISYCVSSLNHVTSVQYSNILWTTVYFVHSIHQSEYVGDD